MQNYRSQSIKVYPKIKLMFTLFNFFLNTLKDIFTKKYSLKLVSMYYNNTFHITTLILEIYNLLFFYLTMVSKI